MTGDPNNMPGMITVFFWEMVAGTVAGAAGAGARQLWDGLPRNSDR
jgi:hypothetical protein